MSSIKSNSIGSLDPQDYQQLDNQNILDKILNFPIKSKLDLDNQTINDDKRNARKKLRMFINCFLQQIKFKNKLKKVLTNLSQLDEVKASNGLNSIKKQILKFNVFIKHHSIEECKLLLTELIIKVLIGDQ